ncbi:MFS transporter [Rouxiella sp. S1S-2]|uniref:MFS transporter n=1 Tax=Rouxiella sp. S1S-2 TaxID=2653856 RepID=UPI0012650795|nr:MFS transporter [Rouxiella sp. S1S-2]KAB7896355.1 MFS transporter [Rouxiella sp. S1S-2]
MKNVLEDGLPNPQRLGAILTLALGITVPVLDSSLANVALPTIARDFNASAASSIWIVNAYQLAITVSLLSLASLGEIFGYKRVYQIGLLVFSFTSLGCAMSDSLLSLTVARILQGFGAAAILSVNMAMIKIIYPKKLLARGIATGAIIVSVSASAGPTVAGIILSIASWPWLFAINLPIGIIALCMGFKYLPENPLKNPGRRFDFISSLLNALTFGLFISAISGYAQGVNHHLIFAEVVSLIIIGGFYIRRELSRPLPLLPLDLLRIPIFSLSLCTSMCSFAAYTLAFVSLPFFLQNSLRLDAGSTGLLMTAWPLATMLMAPFSGRLVGRYHSGVLGGIGLLIFSCGLFALALLPPDPAHLNIVWRMLLCGAGFGLFQSPNNHTIVSSAPSNRSGGASGLLGTARVLGQTVGAALVALMFNLFLTHGTYASLMLAGTLAVSAAIISITRVMQKPALANI